MDARRLRDEADKMRTTAQSLRTDAEKMRETAKGHEADGGDGTAEWQQAEDIERRAQELEQQAEAALAQATNKEMRARELEQEKSRVEAEMKQRLKDLEKETQRLRGGPVGLFG